MAAGETQNIIPETNVTASGGSGEGDQAGAEGQVHLIPYADLAAALDVTCDCPTLTQWGVIVLVILLMGSAGFILIRRKKELAIG